MITEEVSAVIERATARVHARNQVRFDQFVERVEGWHGAVSPDQERWLGHFSRILSSLTAQGWTESDVLRFIRDLPADHFDENASSIPSLKPSPLELREPHA